MKNWWTDTPLEETCGCFHCKYFSMYGCQHPNRRHCKNGSLYWPWDVNNDDNPDYVERVIEHE